MTVHSGQTPNPIATPSMPTSGRSAQGLPTQCFSVIAETDPSALPRVLEVFAKLTLIPSQCHASRVGSCGQELHIDLQFAHMNMATAEHLARSLRAIFLVNSVLTSEKRQRLSA